MSPLSGSDFMSAQHGVNGWEDAQPCSPNSVLCYLEKLPRTEAQESQFSLCHKCVLGGTFAPPSGRHNFTNVATDGTPAVFTTNIM